MVKIWAPTAAKKWNCIQTLDVHMERINDIKFSNKGDLLFTASDDKTIRLCKMMNSYAEYEETFSGTFAPIDCISLSPNNLKLVACDRD
jgi:WD40 repeat protein